MKGHVHSMNMPLGLDIREGKYCRWKTHRNLLVCSTYNLPKSNYKKVQTFAADPETLHGIRANLQMNRIK